MIALFVWTVDGVLALIWIAFLLGIGAFWLLMIADTAFRRWLRKRKRK